MTIRPLARVLLGSGLSLALLASPALMPSASASPKDPKLAAKVASVMKDSRTRGTGLRIVDATDGTRIYTHDSTVAKIPASNTKLLTGAAALDILGTGFRFRTQVLSPAAPKSGKVASLTLRGGGDPTTLESDYATLAKQVKASGVRSVSGRLVVDDTYFDQVNYNPTWSTSYLSDYYAAQVSALTLSPDTDYDAGTVIIKASARKKGQSATLSVTPASAKGALRLVNRTTTTTSGSTWISLSRKKGTNTITVSGRIRIGASSRDWVTVDKPELVAATVFRTQLAKQGIKVAGGTVQGGTAKNSRVLATDTSMTLGKLMIPFMKLSNNMHAEALTKTIARKRTGKPGSWPAGTAAITSWLKSQKIDTTGLVLRDGSGLTRSNRITPIMMTRALVTFRKKSWFSTFRTSLPVAGSTNRMTGGTLSKRMRGTAGAGRVLAKTGTLTGVTALSGYITGRDGRVYAFSMISNYSGSTPRPVEDKVAATVAGWRR